MTARGGCQSRKQMCRCECRRLSGETRQIPFFFSGAAAASLHIPCNGGSANMKRSAKNEQEQRREGDISSNTRPFLALRMLFCVCVCLSYLLRSQPILVCTPTLTCIQSCAFAFSLRFYVSSLQSPRNNHFDATSPVHYRSTCLCPFLSPFPSHTPLSRTSTRE
jgi:hypothetical protein